MTNQTELLETKAWKSLVALYEESPERCKEVLVTACALQDIRDADHAEFQWLTDWIKREHEAMNGRQSPVEDGQAPITGG